jgi:hypothetical protein
MLITHPFHTRKREAFDARLFEVLGELPK